ncbi:hypothetical protein [Saccharopolyspora shandongensis]
MKFADLGAGCGGIGEVYFEMASLRVWPLISLGDRAAHRCGMAIADHTR